MSVESAEAAVALEISQDPPALRRDQLRCLPPACHAFRSFRVPFEQVESRADYLDLRARSEALLERLDPIRVRLLQHQWFAHRHALPEYTDEYTLSFTIRPGRPQPLSLRAAHACALHGRPRAAEPVVRTAEVREVVLWLPH